MKARWTQVLLCLLAALALGLVFALYLRPDFVLDVANQMWGCY